jgi:predicted permease
VLSSVLRDLRFAARLLLRARAFALTAVVTLTLGIGVNTGVFSIINGVLRPLPVPDADRIVILAADVAGDDTGLRFQFSFPALQDYRQQATAFSDIFAYDTELGGLSIDGSPPARFVYQAVTGNFFSGLGLTPATGRLLAPGEGEDPGAESVVVLGHAFWMQRFGGRHTVIGSMVRIDGRPLRVIGVAPEGFRGLYNGVTMDGYVPLVHMQRRGQSVGWYAADRTATVFILAARLKPDVALEDAQAEADLIAARLRREYPATDQHTYVRVVPEPLARPIPMRFFGSILPVIRSLLYILSTLVLLLACLNVTNLLFVRATLRAREMAVRTALGSGRVRLIRLLLAESSLLAVAGALAGVVLGQGAGLLLLNSLDFAIDLPITVDFRFDWGSFRHALLVAAGCAVAVGLLPALRASRAQVTEVLHDGGRNATAGGRHRLRSALVVAQVGGSLVLLIVAGLLVRSLQRADTLDLGFDAEQLLTVRLDPGQLGYDLDRGAAVFAEVERRVRALPGVAAAALAFNTPMSYLIGSCPIEAEGAANTDMSTWPAVAYNSVGTDYFHTLRLPIVRGRPFDDRELGSTTPVVVVNETLAARFWPGADPIGKRLHVRCVGDEPPWEVIGIARDSKYIAVFEQPQPYVYVAAAQTRPQSRMLIVRSPQTPDELGPRLRQTIAAVDADVPLSEMRTMRGVIGGSLGNVMFRIGARQAGAMGVIGLVLAVVGVYGVASYGASQRTREIGIRLALGAHPTDVRQLILRQGVGLVAAGVVLGLGLSVGLTSMLTQYVVLGSAADPVAIGGVTLTLVAIALMACYLPARRAMRIDPIVALRHE